MRPAALASVLLSVALPLSGCSSSHGSPVDAAPAWDAIHPLFHPSPLPIAQAIGLAGAAPIAPDATSSQVRAVDLGLMKAAGITAERFDAYWNLIEPSRGTFTFAPIDPGVADLLAAGVTPEPILDYGNTWANASSCGSIYQPPDDPADFAAFAGQVAAHLRGKAHRYEIWNEENLGLRFWEPRADPAGYAALLAAAGPAIHAADPSAVVVLGGLFFHGSAGLAATDFLDTMYSSRPSITGAFDVVGIHPYPDYPPAVPPEYAGPNPNAATCETEVPEPLMLAQVRDVMAMHGDGGKPIAATEIGWPTYGLVTEDMQARWMVRSILLLLASGAESIDWYQLEDGNATGTLPAENHFGLVSYASPGSTPAPKRAWGALQALLKTCGGLHITADVRQTLSLPADGYAYRLDGSGSRVTVLWRADESQPATTVMVPVTGRSVSIVTLDGTSTPAPAGSAVSAPLGTEPVYVVESL